MGLFDFFNKKPPVRDVDESFDRDVDAAGTSDLDAGEIDDLLSEVETESQPQTETAPAFVPLTITTESETDVVFEPEGFDPHADTAEDTTKPTTTPDEGIVAFDPDMAARADETLGTGVDLDEETGELLAGVSDLDENDAETEDTAESENDAENDAESENTARGVSRRVGGDKETAAHEPGSWVDTNGRAALAAENDPAEAVADLDMPTVPDDVRARAQEYARTTRPEHAGPFDSQEVGLSFFAERDKPVTAPTLPRHSLVGTADDVTVRVWTNRAAFYVPLGSRLIEEREDARQVPDETPHGEQQRYREEASIVDTLHVVVPPTDTREAFTAAISVFSAPSTGGLWASEGWEHTFTSLNAIGVDVDVVASPWGVAVEAHADNQQVYVVGVDGPRWCVRVTAYGTELGETAHEIVHTIVNSLVVHRGNEPMGPGQPLDMQVVDRRGNADTRELES